MHAQTKTDNESRLGSESRDHRLDDSILKREVVTMETTMRELFGEVIYSYSRAQAIDDGVLVDLTSKFPNECHIYKYPVACTDAVWSLIEKAINNPSWHNDAAGLVWDILYMSQKGVVSRPDDQTVKFQVIISGAGRQRNYTLKAVCGPGDKGEPVITIMLPNED